MRQPSLLAALLVTALGLSSTAAASDVDFAVVGLIGTGVDTGDAPNNPYRLQLGAAGEVTISGFVIGLRGTRSLGSRTNCSAPCAQVNDLRAIGGDFGFDWQLALLHLGPRLGVGRLKERDGNIVSAYLEPGGVAEIELAIITLGAELRYRAALREPDASGLLVYFRGGVRF